MPQIIPIIVGYVAGYGALAAGYGAAAAWAIGIVTAAVTYFGQQAPDAGAGGSAQVSGQAARGMLVNTGSNSENVRVVYGARRLAGQRIFHDTTGATRKRYHAIYVLCEGPIAGVQRVLFDEQAVEFNQDSIQREIIRFRGVVDRSLSFKVKCVSPAGVAGNYVGPFDKIHEASKEDGAYIRPLTNNKPNPGGGYWYEAAIDLFPFSEDDIQVNDTMAVRIVNNSDDDAYGRVTQYPNAANGWLMTVSVNDPQEGARQVDLTITALLKHHSEPPEENIPRTTTTFASNWRTQNRNTYAGNLAHAARTDVPDPSYSSGSEVYAVLGNQYLGNERSAQDEAIIDLMRQRFPSEIPETSKYMRTAFLYVVLDSLPDVFSGIPQISAEMLGADYLVDPRSGATGWTDNGPVHTYDYMTNKVYGWGIDASDIDIESFKDAANYCDELLDHGYVAGQPRYTSNGVIDTGQKLPTNTKRLLSGFRGSLIYTDKWKLLIDRPTLPRTDFFLSEDNIIGGFDIKLGSKGSRFNAVDANFFSPESNWEADTFPYVNENLLAEDNDTELKASIDLPFTIERWRAGIMAKQYVFMSRHAKQFSVTCNAQGYDLELGDVIPVTHPVMGYEAKPFRLMGLTFTKEGTTKLTIVEYEPASYDWEAADLIPRAPQSNLPNLRNLPAPSYLNIFTGDEYALIHADGAFTPRLYIEYGAVPYVDYYEIEYFTATTGTPQQFLSNTNEAYISDVTIGESYTIQVRGVTGPGTKTDWVISDESIVAPKNEPPPNVKMLRVITQEDGTREFDWPHVDDRHVDGYVIRWSSLSSVWDDMKPYHSGVLPSSPYESNRLAAGTYYFAIRAKDKSAELSPTPYVVQVTLGDSRLSDGSRWFLASEEGWPGTITGGAVNDNGSITAVSSYDWSDEATWEAWESFAGNQQASIVYESTAIDLGSVSTFTVDLSEQGIGSITTLISVSDDNSSFDAYHAPGSESGRYVKVQTTVTQQGSEVIELQALSAVFTG